MSSADRTLIDELLQEQQRLTAVEKFSRRHEDDLLPKQQRFYKDLIPLSVPGAGEQYAFEVDLDACSGCKACVVACHSLNGLDENESWRRVGQLHGHKRGIGFQQTVTSACHHCIDPGCSNGCPVKAYEKDLRTGIVRHLDDQCIGCQYCSWTCSYDVPRYSKTRGIVRKCDMCSSRLSAGEAPACVQSCPNGAIAIRIVNKAERRSAALLGNLVPTAPDSTITYPSTIYRSAKHQPADIDSSRKAASVEPAHMPLVVMLVVTQFSVGAFTFGSFTATNVSDNLKMVAAVLGLAGLVTSVFHLGRPLQAWRSFLGWRQSWLSREVLVFGAFGGAITLDVFLSILKTPIPFSSLAVVGTGITAVFCSVMVYAATRRVFWRFSSTAGRFFGTVLLLGVAAKWVASTWAQSPDALLFAKAVLAVATIKLGWETTFLFRGGSPNPHSELMLGKLSSATLLRYVTGITGGLLAPAVFALGATDWKVPFIACLLCVIGELAERFLFFTAVAPPKMPHENK